MVLRQTRTAALWLVLVAAMLLRAGMPTGWMPVTKDDSLRIMLCGGDGPIELPTADSPHHGHAGHHAHHQPPDEQQGPAESHRDPCPFGLALGTALDLPAPPASIDAPLAAPSRLPEPTFAAARIAARRAERPPARGPPAIA